MITTRPSLLASQLMERRPIEIVVHFGPFDEKALLNQFLELLTGDEIVRIPVRLSGAHRAVAVIVSLSGEPRARLG